MIAVRGRRVLVPEGERREAWVVLEDDRIVDVAGSPPRSARPVDLGDVDLVPGLVDLHSDCLELKARPRPSMELPLEAALLELDVEAAAWGVTTHYLCVCLEDDLGKYRSVARAEETVAAVEAVRAHLLVDHRVHLRVDVTGDGVPAARALAESPSVGMLSYMVHLPGIGQFPDEASWRRYYTSVQAEGDAVDARLERRRSRLAGIAEARAAVAGIAGRRRVPLAAHDDETAAAVQRSHALGVTISEFPLTPGAADAARELEMAVVMGAPNARHGRSHHGHLSAREALAAGSVSVLASDYHPPSLLCGAYALADEGACSWAEALALVTSGPARAAGLPDRGRIEPGARADLVAVGRRAALPAVARTWVAGREVR
jgi:alpha-D-ribose 1-methylphosphonate 5-triphosphate diphosphatase